jgi:hypothetical protein
MACLPCFDPLPLGSGSAGHPPTITPFGGYMAGCPPHHEITFARPPTGPFFVVRDCVLDIKLGLCAPVSSLEVPS